MGDSQNSIMLTLAILDAGPQHNKEASALAASVLNSFGIQPDLDGIDRDIAGIGMSNTRLRPSFIAISDSSVVGVATMNLENPSNSLISGLYVSFGHRRCGIGRALLNHMISYARTQHVKVLRLETRERFKASVKLYESTGWIRGPDKVCDSGPERQYFLKLD